MEITIRVELTDEIIKKISDEIAKTNATDKKTESVTKNYSVAMVAELTGKHPQTIISHIHNEILIAKKVGKSYVITTENFKNYINAK